MNKKPSEYNHLKLEKKWQSAWKKSEIYKTIESGNKPKSYVLDMFPYPSGAGLHVGHPKGYIATDIYARFKRMNGFNVLHPMGWDAFGLPAEEFALKNKIHPSIAVKQNIKRYKEQLSVLGFCYDWSREINTTDPEYYKWTQWAFLQIFKKGLTYESHEPINWCPSCKTGLANEDLENGLCERCHSAVEQKPIRQWVIAITKYADRLLTDLDELDWPNSIKVSQKNWIGRSEGVNFKCTIKDLNIPVEMYNSVPQSYFAETFTAIAPDHPLVPTLIKGTPNEKEILDFLEDVKKRKAANKFDVEKEIEGIFTGRYIQNFADTGKDLPIWIASFVVSTYGTGIVNCSAHDTRDFAFAKKYKIPLHPVTFPADPVEAERVKNLEYCYARDSEGILHEPEKFNGRKWGEARQDIIDHIVKGGFGTRKVNYKLRDWVFSRQRYWGEPIPLIHCEKCGVVPVPENELPLKLPNVKFYEPTGTGESPLAAITKWVNIKCPQCKGPAKRETNTMPQWAGSCWYYLRFMDPKNNKQLVDPEIEKYWSPVDVYVGGTEHATRHLIYARFWHKFLYDIGVVSESEPFKQLRNQGLIMGPDGQKMSKRFGNVINPDDIVKLYGADSLRVYEMFMGPFEQAISWSTDNMIGSRRFIEKIWRLKQRVVSEPVELKNETVQIFHKTIKKVGEDIQSFAHNTAISSLMILLNAFEGESAIDQKTYETLLLLVAPFAPHIADELWSQFGYKKSIHLEVWPSYDPAKLAVGTFKIAVQINGKLRGVVEAEKDDEEYVKKLATESTEIQKYLQNMAINKVIYVKGRLVNFVVKRRLDAN